MFLSEKHRRARIGDEGKLLVAVFHLKMSVCSRAGGQSAVAKADYIEREGRYEQDREELEHRESDHMPEWAEEDPRSYWEAAGRVRAGQRAAVPGSPVRASQGTERGAAAGAGLRVREAADRRGAAALYDGHPSRGRREPPRPPDVLGAGQ